MECRNDRCWGKIGDWRQEAEHCLSALRRALEER
jgi:hypothetical protein